MHEKNYYSRISKNILNLIVIYPTIKGLRQNLGAVGDTNYQCKKFSTLVQTKSSPKNSSCPAGNYHDWEKL